MVARFSEPGSPESSGYSQEPGDEGGNEPTGLLPAHPPAVVLPHHHEAVPGAEQVAAVDWVRLPHWRLVKQIQEGDQEALAWVMETYRPALLRYARKMLAGSADPEDIVQEAFFRLWARRGSLRPTGSIRAFLFISVRTIARDEYRRWGRRWGGGSAVPFPDRHSPDDPVEDLQGSELLLHLGEAVNSLSPRRKQVFRMLREEGLSMEEVARRLDLTPRTVKNTMTAALRELRSKLGPFLP